jgi:hypothetical protein
MNPNKRLYNDSFLTGYEPDGAMVEWSVAKRAENIASLTTLTKPPHA